MAVIRAGNGALLCLIWVEKWGWGEYINRAGRNISL